MVRPTLMIAGMLLIVTLLAGCGAPPPAAAVPTTTSLAPDVATPTVAVTPSATSPVAEAGVLPAPLYLLGGQDENQLQIWRVEVDGETTSQITDEPTGVRDFDVSAADGSVVYVAGEELVRVDALGGSRQVLFTAPPPSVEPNPMAPPRQLSEPRLSPDGTRLAFRLEGLNLLTLADGSVVQVLADDPLPADMSRRPERPLYFYHVAEWSPDGGRLLVRVAYFPEGSEYAIYSVAENRLVSVEGQSMVCCTRAWGPDGAHLWIAQDLPGMVSAGLWRADATTGAVESFATMDDATGLPSVMVVHPNESADGRLYAWRRVLRPGSAGQVDPYLQPSEMAWAPVGQVGDPSVWQPASDQLLRPIEVLWDPADGGAVVSVEEGRGWLPTGNTLLWVPADGTRSHPLPLPGLTLRWGR